MSIAVIIPVYNEKPAHLNATIRSAQKAMADEIIVVDDGSDVPAQVKPAPGVYLYRRPHKGKAAALNYGIEMSISEYITCVDSRDTISPNRLLRHQEYMNVGKLHAIFSDYRNPHKNEDVITKDGWEKHIWTDNQFCMCLSTFSRTIWKRVKGFDETLMYCIDWDFSSKVHSVTAWVYLPGIEGTAAEWPGGHTDRAMNNKTAGLIRNADRVLVLRRNRGRRRENNALDSRLRE